MRSFAEPGELHAFFVTETLQRKNVIANFFVVHTSKHRREKIETK